VPDALRDPKRLSLLAAIMGSFVVGLDSTVVNVALPSIASDLGGGLAGQQWVSNAYLLALGSLILIGGSLGDVFGERRVFALGVGGFGAVSVVCALAPSIEVLIAGRALQGVFGALLTPSALAVIVSAFPGDERGGAIGSWTAWSGISTVIGPLAGGYLIDATSWRWIFAINVPFVLLTLMLVGIAVPKRERGMAGERRRIDVVGALLCALGLAGPVTALIRQPMLGWGSLGVVLPAVGGIALLVAFIWWEGRVAQPMLPLGLFARRNFAVGNAQTFAMYGGLGITFFFLVLFLQQVAGYDALQAGLATLPTTLVMFFLSKRAGRMADRYGPRAFMGLGPLVAAAGLFLMLRIDATPSYWADILPALLVFSLGLSATVAPLTATVLADADERNAGIASGVNNAVARVASLLAVAALGAAVSASFSSAIDASLEGRPLSAQSRAAVESAKDRTLATIDTSGLPVAERAPVAAAVRDASVDAFHLGLGLAGALVGLGGVLGLVGIANPRRDIRCEDCAGGQLVTTPLTAVHTPELASAELPTASGYGSS
jgi:EmrB/QacA subfamily drug resistance transporter